MPDPLQLPFHELQCPDMKKRVGVPDARLARIPTLGPLVRIRGQRAAMGVAVLLAPRPLTPEKPIVLSLSVNLRAMERPNCPILIRRSEI